MSHPRQKIKQQVDRWREGSFVDLWTLVHFLAGVLLGFAALLAPFSFNVIFITVLVILVGWEIFEFLRDIHETIYNRIVDVLIAFVGFGLVIALVPFLPLTIAQALGVAFFILFLLLNLSGWSSYRKRVSRKQ